MILLASPSYVKSLGVVDTNVNDELVVTAITDAQEIDMQALIGTNLLNTIKTQSDTNTLTPDNLNLRDNYISPTIARYSLYYLSMYLNNRITARGVVSKKSDSSDVVTSDDLQMLRKDLLSISEWYAQRMIRYILANIAKYQLFFTITDISQMRGKLNSYTTGWVLNSGSNYIAGLPIDRSQFDCNTQ